MKTSQALQSKIKESVWNKRARLVDITRQLIQTPSENTPPYGSELACQKWLACQLQDAGLETDLYALEEIDGLTEHPLYSTLR